MIRALFAVIFVGLGLAACSMAQSTLIQETATTGCSSTAGSYFLSKSYVKVVVGGSTAPTFYLKNVQITHRADRAHKYCLDYLGSPTANEAFVVERNPAGLLRRIYSNAEDQSAKIAKTLAKTLFTAASGNANFNEERSTGGATPATPDIFTAEYDPFDPADAALTNDGLRYFGYCLVIEAADLPPAARNVDDYCERPLAHSSRERAMRQSFDHAAAGDGHVIKEVRGILYRPRVAYVLYLFQKANLKVHGGWSLRASEAVHMENQSPILSVGVDRAFFASRKTNLLFDDGVLYDINIDKKSELAGFVEVPLYIAQGIAALPANIIQVRINANTSQTNLINAQSQLIQSRIDYATTLASLRERQKPAGTVTTPDGQPALSNAKIPDEQTAPAADGQPRSANVSGADRSADLDAGYTRCLATGGGPELAKTTIQGYCSCVWKTCAKSNTNIDACKTTCSNAYVP
jgi:hypothetical protein